MVTKPSSVPLSSEEFLASLSSLFMAHDFAVVVQPHSAHQPRFQQQQVVALYTTPSTLQGDMSVLGLKLVLLSPSEEKIS